VQPRSQAARLQLRWVDGDLRVHASRRHGQRSRDRLLSIPRGPPAAAVIGMSGGAPILHAMNRSGMTGLRALLVGSALIVASSVLPTPRTSPGHAFFTSLRLAKPQP